MTPIQKEAIKNVLDNIQSTEGLNKNQLVYKLLTVKLLLEDLLRKENQS